MNMVTVINCERCGARCKVAGPRNPNAKMLRRSGEAKGLCVNCAVHDWLRNTYPVNLIFTTLSPDALRLEHIQQQFTEIMRIGFADAQPDEIDWEAIIANWDLPFKNKVKATAMNPASQDVLDREPAEQVKREKLLREGLKPPTTGRVPLTITSFEQLNELEPGLGDELEKCFRKE